MICICGVPVLKRHFGGAGPSIFYMIRAECLFCHIYWAQLGTHWFKIVETSRAVFNRESPYPPLFCGKVYLFCSPVSPSLEKATYFHRCLVGTKLIVVLFWQALVKVILRTLERDELMTQTTDNLKS